MALDGPIASTISKAAASCFAVQILFGIHAIYTRSDRYTDFSSCWTFLACLLLSVLDPWTREPPGTGMSAYVAGCNWRQLVLTGLAILYAFRLSAFLFLRVLAKGHDSRFDETKTKPVSFAVFWIAQAMWIALASLPIVVVNAVPKTAFKTLPRLLLTDVVGLFLFVLGFTVECVADAQKARWYSHRKQKHHDELFITRGLWGRSGVALTDRDDSRYPHYFGDITLWTGIALAAAGVLVASPVQASLGWKGEIAGRICCLLCAFVSPGFVAFVLLRVSGVPLSEDKYDRLYGHRADYQHWRYNTPRLCPRVF